MSKKLLSIAFLSVISTGMPAYAVDYVACREMLRTKNEFISISNQYENGKIRTQGIYTTMKEKNDLMRCMDLPYDYTTEPIPIKNWKEGDIPAPLKFSTPRLDCMDRISERQNIRRNQGETKSRGLYFLIDEGHYYHKKALKVEADMKRANCPY